MVLALAGTVADEHSAAGWSDSIIDSAPDTTHMREETRPMVTSQATILVVDDDPKHLRLVDALLQPRGYTVVTSSDGAEALDQVHRAYPDLILLDVMMPLVDGFEVCKLLKDHPATA
jgi:PleD family two-component response regulator